MLLYFDTFTFVSIFLGVPPPINASVPPLFLSLPPINIDNPPLNSQSIPFPLRLLSISLTLLSISIHLLSNLTSLLSNFQNYYFPTIFDMFRKLSPRRLPITSHHASIVRLSLPSFVTSIVLFPFQIQ